MAVGNLCLTRPLLCETPFGLEMSAEPQLISSHLLFLAGSSVANDCPFCCLDADCKAQDF